MQIQFSGVDHLYMPKTPFQHLALSQVNVEIPSGSFTVIVGPTGSGKSTLVQHVNGLLHPTEGEVQVGEHRLTSKKDKRSLRKLREATGFLFQYPEHQLFEETVEKELIFGPMNFGVSKEEAESRAKEVLPQVGLPTDLLTHSPLNLSGGQMRRVAIASILAQHPKVLILDEPAAGLDPEGRQRILDMLYTYHMKHKLTSILVTHHMEDALRFADYMVVMNKGSVYLSGKPEEVFGQSSAIESIGLELPETIRFMQQFKLATNQQDVPFLKTRGEVVDYIAEYRGRME
ncbi:energy-coupling factor transporter ATPase [Alkalicoccobacillus gibsonii]|uniref:energy-coupling factor transporter ATPase n=1 Tax=Alkalicoccobacillus gibsonii TaxID=79881 RepID=UPI0035144F31